jgi:hypothetical protein
VDLLTTRRVLAGGVGQDALAPLPRLDVHHWPSTDRFDTADWAKFDVRKRQRRGRAPTGNFRQSRKSLHCRPAGIERTGVGAVCQAP